MVTIFNGNDENYDHDDNDNTNDNDKSKINDEGYISITSHNPYNDKVIKFMIPDMFSII